MARGKTQKRTSMPFYERNRRKQGSYKDRLTKRNFENFEDSKIQLFL